METENPAIMRVANIFSTYDEKIASIMAKRAEIEKLRAEVAHLEALWSPDRGLEILKTLCNANDINIEDVNKKLLEKREAR